MKIKSFLIISAMSIAVASCQPEVSDLPQNPEPKILASKTDIAAGNSVALAIQNPGTNSYSRWTVMPSAGVTIDSVYSRQQNTITFTQTGTYTISAQMRTVHPDCRPSPGWDTCYNSAPTIAQMNSTINVKN